MIVRQMGLIGIYFCKILKLFGQDLWSAFKEKGYPILIKFYTNTSILPLKTILKISLPLAVSLFCLHGDIRKSNNPWWLGSSAVASAEASNKTPSCGEVAPETSSSCKAEDSTTECPKKTPSPPECSKDSKAEPKKWFLSCFSLKNQDAHKLELSSGGEGDAETGTVFYVVHPPKNQKRREKP